MRLVLFLMVAILAGCESGPIGGNPYGYGGDYPGYGYGDYGYGGLAFGGLVAGIRGVTTMTVDIRLTSTRRTDSFSGKNISRSFSEGNSDSSSSRSSNSSSSARPRPRCRRRGRPLPRRGSDCLIS